ncbi:sialoadhesin isoform X1 [Entelurus aequoreus]|uniref:sialoadhesin isoform X1 n=1 Tax=Entelurus aequoreus TaxID=161455 RepID=UPI002B1E2ADA|nr:sialoadhesin isoform X1 [Entelurus aequoreus]
MSLLWTLVFAAAMLDEVQSSAPEPSVPDRVVALAGSCVVVPCSFPPKSSPSPPPANERVDVRMRYRGDERFLFRLSRTAYNSEETRAVSADFRGRVTVAGQGSEGDCSLRLDTVRVDDARVYEVSLKTRGDSTWGRTKSFSLLVLVNPEAPVISGVLSAMEGQVVTLNCSVGYYCPSSPPTLRWQWGRGVHPPGAQEVRTLHPDEHSPVLQASLTFRVSQRVNAGLRCELSYAGAKAVVAANDLHVTFPPKDVTVQVQTLALQEGGSALLACSCKADPPASEYSWSYSRHGRMVHLGLRTHAIRLYNVTRGTAVRCAVENLVGRAESRTTVLNVLYKPVIQRASSACVVERQEVLCRCSADSNPRPAFTWSINGTAPPPDYNVSLTADMLTSTLRGRMSGPLTLTCSAVNTIGNDSLTLWHGGRGRDTLLLLGFVAPAAAILASALIAVLVFYCCRKKAATHVLTGRTAAGLAGGSGANQECTPLYINCTEVTHVYTNGSYQLVYQNCTPHFVRTKQVRRMGRRGGERRRRALGVRADTQDAPGDVHVAEPESAIYLEVL